MAQLGNIKHERFARLVANGISKSKAYVRAGYTANNGNATRLWSHKGKASERIQRRVGEIMANSAELTARDILDRVLNTYELATESGQHSAALKACEMLGKELGLFRDRRESINLNLSAMNPDQTKQFLLERYGDRAKGIIEHLWANHSPQDSKPLRGNVELLSPMTYISQDSGIIDTPPDYVVDEDT